MATMGSILFKDESGDIINGPREDGSSFIYEFKAEVTLLSSSTPIVIDRRRVEVFWIVKSIDELTPDLLNILISNKICKEIKITLFRIGIETGLLEDFFSYTFSDAKIVSINNWMNSVYDPTGADNPHFERIGIVARDITWEHKPTSKSATIIQWGSENN
jgi:type VI secretion system Hcp family effector